MSEAEIMACDCTHTLPMFCASLIGQPWMQSAKHVPAVLCQCGKTYWSLAERTSFACKAGDDTEIGGDL